MENTKTNELSATMESGSERSEVNYQKMVGKTVKSVSPVNNLVDVGSQSKVILTFTDGTEVEI